MNVTVLTETASTITIGWTPPAGQEGYVPTIDGSELLTDSKRHASVDRAASKVKIGKLLDGKPHAYGVEILGVSAFGSVISPVVTPPPPPPSAWPNALGDFGTKVTSGVRDDSQKLIDLLVGAVTGPVAFSTGSYGVSAVYAKTTDPIVSAVNLRGWGTAPGTSRFYCPTTARPSQGTDKHLVVIQPDGSGFEMWQCDRQPDGNFTAGSVSHFAPGQWNYPTRSGARGSSFTLLSGVVLAEEIKAGHIPHAGAISVPPGCLAQPPYPPANASDAPAGNAYGLQEGMRLFFEPTVSLAGLKPAAKTLATMLVEYGGILVDRSGTVFEIDGMAPESYPSDPWASIDLGLGGFKELLPQLKVAA